MVIIYCRKVCALIYQQLLLTGLVMTEAHQRLIVAGQSQDADIRRTPKGAPQAHQVITRDGRIRLDLKQKNVAARQRVVVPEGQVHHASRRHVPGNVRHSVHVALETKPADDQHMINYIELKLVHRPTRRTGMQTNYAN